MDKNLISVIIATKNGGCFLLRSVASIERQNYKNIEVIIVSDGSTDNTIEIAHKLAETRPFIKIIELKENIGPGLARNVGIKEAKGEYIALLDDDDEWLDPNKVETQKKFLDENLDHVLIGASETDFVSDKKGFLFTYKPKKTDTEIRKRILILNQFMTSSVMFRKTSFEQVEGFSDMYLAEDYDLWLRLAKIGKVANIDNCKTRYYKRSSSAQNSNKNKMNKVVLNLIKEYKNDFPNYYIALLIAYIRIIRG